MDLNTVTEVVRPTAREELPPWRDGDAWLAGGTWLFSEPQPTCAGWSIWKVCAGNRWPSASRA